MLEGGTRPDVASSTVNPPADRGDATPDSSSRDSSRRSTSPLDRLEAALRALARSFRAVATRSLHPVRRAAARRRLRSLERIDSLLFLCHGNICRSPYAEVACRRRVGDHVTVRSAGFLEEDRRPPEEALRAAGERGIDLSDHRSRRLDRELLATSGLVVVMDPEQDRMLCRRYRRSADLVLGDLDPRSAECRAIRDPIFQPIEVFDDVYDRIDRCVGGLARALEHDPGPDRVGENRKHS
ncbi:MAG: hypothetical protein R3266_00050 [Gemmatimonadota bacterium]|nr:hypothetical protein [Gemmatimonadota bacterium]